ncbi:hypothetical protein U2F26_02345 [Micromonospora sp. 4G57]|uniref:Uncharacterized protein n=1 Tax=Micromonospora sicca TaxID=2202420 RepID=A0ABU5JBJ5_9ACTN|nr:MULTISPECIES: hypothetical protein [unclassified Micromonospora]MDZ5441575.1 hypothetical protein [Micromonospora sp. 4G57]MDZ5489972.1 hypothetical protein [Micromonospora sp. 4G53]
MTESTKAAVSVPASSRHSAPSSPNRSVGVGRSQTARLPSMNGNNSTIEAVRTAAPAVRAPQRYASTATPSVEPPAAPLPGRGR